MTEENAAIAGDHEVPLPGLVSKLRVVGIIEGISTLALFGIAMPLKYIWGYDQAVSIVGGVHGGLFILYILWAFVVILKYGWPFKLGIIMFIGAVIPFGPFVVDRKIPAWYHSNR